MHTDYSERNGITSIAFGMVGDAHQLLQQEIALAKAEIRQEITNIKVITLSLIFSFAVILLGSAFIPFLLSDLILYLSNGQIPRWGSYCIVSSTLIFLGIGLFSSANNKLKNIINFPKNIPNNKDSNG